MARKLDDIFNECYERIRAGESLQSCLARYPEHRAELKSLLETTFDIGRRASYIHPRPEFKHWAQVRIQGAQHYASQQGQVAKPGHFSWWRQSWAVAVTAVLVLLLTTGSTMAASSNAMPDQTLYPMKLATEEMRLAFAVTDTQKAQLHTELAVTRAAEVEAMANKGKTEHAAITAARLAKQLEKADSAIAKAESTAGIAPPTTVAPEPTKIEPLPPTPPEEVPAVQPPVTEEQPPVTEVQPPVTEEQPTTTEQQPPVTEEKPPVTEEQATSTEGKPPVTEEKPSTIEEPKTTPAATKYDKWVDQRERLKNRLEESKARTRVALENARENASEQNKSRWQQAIDAMKEKNKDNQSDKK